MYIYPINTKDTTGLEMELQDSTFCDECMPDCELTQHYTNEYKTEINQFDDKDFIYLFVCVYFVVLHHFLARLCVCLYLAWQLQRLS